MVSPLRQLRKSKGMTLEKMQELLAEVGLNKTVSHLSLVETGKVWPGRDVVNALVSIFPSEISVVEILYPFDGSSNE